MDNKFSIFLVLLIICFALGLLFRVIDTSGLIYYKVKYSKHKLAKKKYKEKWRLWQRLLLIPFFYESFHFSVLAVIDNFMLLSCIISAITLFFTKGNGEITFILLTICIFTPLIRLLYVALNNRIKS